MQNLVIYFILAATALAGVKDKDFMQMWPEYFEGLYGLSGNPAFYDIEKNITEASKPVYEALEQATATLYWFTMVHVPEYSAEEEEKYESRIEVYYRTAVH